MRHWLNLILALCCLVGFARPSPAQTPDPVNLTAIWFNQSEAGYGVNVVHQGSILFVAWYTYGADGKVLWLLAAATRQADGRYVGPIDTFDGQPFNQINNAQAWTASNRVGEARLQLQADGKLDFGYTVNGITQSKRLEKVAFVANPPTCSFTTGSRASATNYTDVWWKANESGWGLSMIHQGNSIFIAWYTYGANGKAQWITGLATRQANGTFTGELNRPATGTPFNQINGPATSFPLPVVGNFSLSFSDGENGTFAYTLDGISQSKPVSRFVYVPAGAPVTLCTEPGSGGGGGGGTLTSCDPGYTAGDFRTSRLEADASTTTERVIGPGTFQGQQVIIVDSFDANNVITGRVYAQQTATELRTLAAEGYSNGVLATTTVFNPPAVFRRNLAVGESYTLSYTGSQSGPQLPFPLTIQYQETVSRSADETETVPAGTFRGCRFDRLVNSTTLGVSTSVDLDMWMAPQVGTFRTRARTQTPAGTFENEIRLLRANVQGVNYGN